MASSKEVPALGADARLFPNGLGEQTPACQLKQSLDGHLA
jgi:hypothetical protein